MNIKFLRGTQAQFNACTKRAETLYFITDTGALYLGDKLIGKNYENAGFQTAAQVGNLISTALANYYTKEEIDQLLSSLNDNFNSIDGEISRIEGLISAEVERAQGIEESLQTQINTIMNNPDTEGVINSINEFTQYIEDHGEVAEGFRTDIDKNKEDIAANTQAIADLSTETETLNSAIGTLKTFLTSQDAVVLAEAQAYADQAESDAIAEAHSYADQAEVDAIAAAKLETQNQVKALEDGQVTTNKNNIANLMIQMTWGDI